MMPPRLSTYFFLAGMFLLGGLLQGCYMDDVDEPRIPNAPPMQTASIDTVFPGSYFPAYPGSRWTYSVNGTIATDTTGANYQIHTYPMQVWDTAQQQLLLVPSDSVYVPFYNGQPIYGYQVPKLTAIPTGQWMVLEPFFQRMLGTFWHLTAGDPRFGDFAERVRVDSAYYDGADTVVVLRGYWVYGQYVNSLSYRAYRRNTGLLHHTIFDTLTLDTLYAKHLVSYQINWP